jgi:hypothetical protein
MDDKERTEKQARLDTLNRKFDNDETTTDEIIEGIQLYFELHPEEKYWNDNRTPADIWGKVRADYQQKGHW